MRLWTHLHPGANQTIPPPDPLERAFECRCPAGVVGANPVLEPF
jgi:hypothetical protein